MAGPVAFEHVELRLDATRYLADLQRLTAKPVVLSMGVDPSQAAAVAKQIEKATATQPVQLKVDTKTFEADVKKATTGLDAFIADLEYLDRQVKGEFSAGLALEGESIASVAEALREAGVTAEVLAEELGVLTQAQEAERKAALARANEAAEAERRRTEEFLKSPEHLAEVAAREAKVEAERIAAAERGAAYLRKLAEERAAYEADRAAKDAAAEAARQAAREAEAAAAQAAEIRRQEELAATIAKLEAEQDARLAARKAARDAQAGPTGDPAAAVAVSAEEIAALESALVKLSFVAEAAGTTIEQELGLAGIKNIDELRAALDRAGVTAVELDDLLGNDADALRLLGVQAKRSAAGLDEVDKAGGRARGSLGRVENVFGNLVGNFVQGAVNIGGAFGPLGTAVGQFADVVGEKLFQGLASSADAAVGYAQALGSVRDIQAAATAAQAAATLASSEAAAATTAATAATGYGALAATAMAEAKQAEALAAAEAAAALSAEAAAAEAAAAATFAAIAPYLAAAAAIAAVAAGIYALVKITDRDPIDELTSAQIKLGDSLLANTDKLRQNSDALSENNSSYEGLTPGVQAYNEAIRQSVEDQAQFNALLAAQQSDQAISGFQELRDVLSGLSGAGATVGAEFQKLVRDGKITDDQLRAIGLTADSVANADLSMLGNQLVGISDQLEDLPNDTQGLTAALADAGGQVGRYADQIAVVNSQYDLLRNSIVTSGDALEKQALKNVEARVAAGEFAAESDAATEALVNEIVALQGQADAAAEAAKALKEHQKATFDAAQQQRDFVEALAAKGIGPGVKRLEQYDKAITAFAQGIIDGTRDVTLTQREQQNFLNEYGKTYQEVTSDALAAVDEIQRAEAEAAKAAEERAARREEIDKAAAARRAQETKDYLDRLGVQGEQRIALQKEIDDQAALAANVADVAAQFGIVDDRISGLSPEALETLQSKVEDLDGAIQTWADNMANISFGGVEDALTGLFEDGKVPTVKQFLDANAKALSEGQQFSDLLQTYYSGGQAETGALLQQIASQYGLDVATKFAEQIEKGGPEAQAALQSGLQFSDAAIAAEKAQWASIGQTMGETIAPELYNAVQLALAGEPFKPLVEIEDEAEKARQALAEKMEREFTMGKIKPKNNVADDVQADLNGRSFTAGVVIKPLYPAGFGSLNGPRFAGGDVEAGRKYTVNELGREMFLRAGSLFPTPINVPAFSDWTAPASGTVINHVQTAQYLRAKADGLNPGVTVDGDTPRMVAQPPVAPAAGKQVVQHNSFTIVAAQPGQARAEVEQALTGLLRRV